MRIGGYIIDNPIALAPMAGITDNRSADFAEILAQVGPCAKC